MQSCTIHYTGTRITMFGGLGGSGTRAIAAALALAGRSMVVTGLITVDPIMMSALIGTTAPADCPAEMEVIGGRILPDPTGASMGSFWWLKQAGPSGSVMWRT